jgi:hypothetical protein
MGSGRVVGIILIVVGIAVGVLAALLLISGVSSEQLTSSGAILGFAIAFVVLVAPLVGFGVFMLVQGRAEDRRAARAQQQRRLLDIVTSRGQVAIADLAIEMQVSAEDIRAMIHQLVGMQVFSGYVNWDKGQLYSAEARRLRDLQKCENCGGEIELKGRGIIACRFCGTEYFLS